MTAKYRTRSVLALFLKMGGWFVVALWAVIFLLGMIGINALSMADKYDAHGVETQAWITGKEVKVTRDSDGDTRRTYYVTFRYQVDGTSYSLRQSTGRSYHDAVSQGAKVDIWYLSNAPREFEYVRGQNRRTSNTLYIAIAVLGLCGLVALWWVGRWAVDARRAAKWGHAYDATYQGMEKTSVKVNDIPLYRLTWLADGRRGESLMRRKNKFPTFVIGDTLTVFRGPRQDWWEGDVGSRPMTESSVPSVRDRT